MEWIRTVNLKLYNIFDAFNTFDAILWRKSNFQIKSGDIVYLYIGVPYSKIIFKTVCTRDACWSAGWDGQKDNSFWNEGKRPDDEYE